MRNHYYYQHKAIANKKFECPAQECSVEFDTRFDRLQHYREVHQPYACPREYCEAKFTTTKSLKNHIRTVHAKGVNVQLRNGHVLINLHVQNGASRSICAWLLVNKPDV